MSDKYSFPAVFHPEEEGFSVWFPDLPGCVTEGDTLEEAASMAKEALSLHLYSLETDCGEIPSVSGKYNLDPGDFIVVIFVNLKVIRAEMRSKSVNTMVTLPLWLKEEAVAAGINMSATLQDALKEKLDL